MKAVKLEVVKDAGLPLYLIGGYFAKKGEIVYVQKHIAKSLLNNPGIFKKVGEVEVPHLASGHYQVGESNATKKKVFEAPANKSMHSDKAKAKVEVSEKVVKEK